MVARPARTFGFCVIRSKVFATIVLRLILTHGRLSLPVRSVNCDGVDSESRTLAHRGREGVVEDGFEEAAPFGLHGGELRFQLDRTLPSVRRPWRRCGVVRQGEVPVTPGFRITRLRLLSRDSCQEFRTQVSSFESCGTRWPRTARLTDHLAQRRNMVETCGQAGEMPEVEVNVLAESRHNVRRVQPIQRCRRQPIPAPFPLRLRRLQPIAQRHQFIHLGDYAVLFGEGWKRETASAARYSVGTRFCPAVPVILGIPDSMK